MFNESEHETLKLLSKQLNRLERKIDHLSHQFAVRQKPVLNETTGNIEQEVIFLDYLINSKINLEDGKEIDSSDNGIITIIHDKKE